MLKFIYINYSACCTLENTTNLFVTAENLQRTTECN